MENLYNYIIEVEKLHRKKQLIEKEERELITPIVKDYSRIDELYAIFANELIKNTDVPADSVESRRLFVFIVARLCCPSVFAGRRLRRGIRDKIASVLGCVPSNVSHNFRNLTTQYKKYRSFRSKVDKVYAAMMETITEK